MIEMIHLASTVALGLFAGALLTEGSILVPYWRRMEPADFFQQHEQNRCQTRSLRRALRTKSDTWFLGCFFRGFQPKSNRNEGSNQKQATEMK